MTPKQIWKQAYSIGRKHISHHPGVTLTLTCNHRRVIFYGAGGVKSMLPADWDKHTAAFCRDNGFFVLRLKREGHGLTLAQAQKHFNRSRKLGFKLP